MNIVLLGMPGVGKGTYAGLLRESLGLLHFSTGNLLRNAVKQDSVLGRQAHEFMEKGLLVPDEVVTALLEEVLSKSQIEKGFILDGYPRNIKQAKELEQLLSSHRLTLDSVIYLGADENVIVERLSGRRICSRCQRNFHIKNMPPKKDGICDYCGGRLYERPDDKKETVHRRLNVYRTQTRTLIDYYENRGLLQRVAANEEARVVVKKILMVLEENGTYKIQR